MDIIRPTRVSRFHEVHTHDWSKAVWNWKIIYQDNLCMFYCDLDKIVGTAADEEGLYAGTECYMPLPERFAVFTSLAFKTNAKKKRYMEERREKGLSIAGYENLQYSLCLAEFDRENERYRIIPVTDYDENDHELGDSSVFGQSGTRLLKGVACEWAKIRSRETHPMIMALYALFFPSLKH